jgi:hypothetical protein
MILKKSAEPPVCHYGSNEPTLDAQFEWSVNTFKCWPPHILLFTIKYRYFAVSLSDVFCGRTFHVPGLSCREPFGPDLLRPDVLVDLLTSAKLSRYEADYFRHLATSHRLI